MIELHRTPEDSFADEIEEAFKDLSVAYKTEAYPDPPEGADLRLPFIRENKEQYAGKEAISNFLVELRDELNVQRSITGDACYIDPETGEIC